MSASNTQGEKNVKEKVPVLQRICGNKLYRLSSLSEKFNNILHKKSSYWKSALCHVLEIRFFERLHNLSDSSDYSDCDNCSCAALFLSEVLHHRKNNNAPVSHLRQGECSQQRTPEYWFLQSNQEKQKTVHGENEYGAGCRNRTDDLLITSQPL